KVQWPSRSRNFGPCEAVTTEQRLNFSRISHIKGKGTRLASVKRKSEKLSRTASPQAMDLAQRVCKRPAKRSSACLRRSRHCSPAPSARKNSSSEKVRDLNHFDTIRESRGVIASARMV